MWNVWKPKYIGIPMHWILFCILVDHKHKRYFQNKSSIARQ